MPTCLVLNLVQLDVATNNKCVKVLCMYMKSDSPNKNLLEFQDLDHVMRRDWSVTCSEDTTSSSDPFRI